MKLSVFFIAVSLLCFAPFCQASLCYIERDDVGCFQLDGETMKTERSYSPCDRVIPVCKDGTLCYANAKGGVTCLERADITLHEPIDIATLSKQRDEQTFVQVLAAIFTPKPEVDVGMKRLATYSDLPGFPDGYVLMPKENLSISISGSGGAQIDEFTLWQTAGREHVFSQTAPSKQIRIPVAVLEHGGEYRWEAIVDGDRFEGAFTIETEPYQNEFEHALKQRLEHGDNSPLSQVIVRAALAKRYGYTFDYMQAVKQARTQMKKGETDAD